MELKIKIIQHNILKKDFTLLSHRTHLVTIKIQSNLRIAAIQLVIRIAKQ